MYKRQRLVQLAGAAVVAVRGEAQRLLEAERPAQQGFAGAQRQAGEVAAVQPQQVEDVVRHRDTAGAGLLGVGELHPLLEAGEVGAAVREGDDLAVDGEVPAPLVAEGIDDFRVAGVDLAAGARQQPDAVRLADAERPHPVELTFEDPAVVELPAVAEHGQHRTHRVLLAGRGVVQQRPLGRGQRVQQVVGPAHHALSCSPASSWVTRLRVRPLRTGRERRASGVPRRPAQWPPSLASSQGSRSQGPPPRKRVGA